MTTTRSKKIGLLLASSAVVLGGAEVLVRVMGRGKFAPRPSCFVPDRETIYRLNANLHHDFHGEDYATEVCTDRYACRLGALGEVPDDKDLVLLSGDSNAFGWGVSTSESAASVLDELLHRHSGQSLRLVNLGVPGYGNVQSARRLAQFLRERPAARARTRVLVFVHCDNDPTDDASLRTLGVLIGAKESYATPLRNPSAIHLWNLLRGVVHPEPNVGYSVRDVHALPNTFAIGQTTIRLRELGREDIDAATTRRRGSLTAIQRALVAEGIAELHQAVADLGIRVHHTVIRTTQPFYERELRAMVAAAPTCGNVIEYAGVLPTELSFEGEVLNRHHGGHFNPRFNREWGTSLFEMLRRNPDLAPK